MFFKTLQAQGRSAQKVSLSSATMFERCKIDQDALRLQADAPRPEGLSCLDPGGGELEQRHGQRAEGDAQAEREPYPLARKPH